MAEYSRTVRTILYAIGAIAGGITATEAAIVYGQHAIGALEFWFAVQWGALAALLFSLQALHASDDEILSILNVREQPAPKFDKDRHPTLPPFFGRWFRGFGDPA